MPLRGQKRCLLQSLLCVHDDLDIPAVMHLDLKRWLCSVVKHPLLCHLLAWKHGWRDRRQMSRSSLWAFQRMHSGLFRRRQMLCLEWGDADYHSQGPGDWERSVTVSCRQETITMNYDMVPEGLAINYHVKYIKWAQVVVVKKMIMKYRVSPQSVHTNSW